MSDCSTSPSEPTQTGLPLVSIVIPVYNAATHLARCIETARRQTYRNLEILLVNDGSKDTSGAICQMYARVDARIRVTNRENSGVSATRNCGLRQATGKYIQFLDSDDYLPRNATQLLVTRAESTCSDLVIAEYYRACGDTLSRHGFLRRTDVMDQTEFARELMDEPASFYYGVLWNKLYRADIIRSQGIECSEELEWSEDFLFNLEYIRYAQRFCALQSPVYYYVKNPDSITHTRIDWRSVVTTKSTLFSYYKDLYTQLGLYENYRLKVHKYLIASAEHS